MKNKKTDYIEYYFYCNACGDKFRAERADARTCSDMCRTAIKNVSGRILSLPPELTQEELNKYNNIVIKIRSEQTGIIRKMLLSKNNDGTFTDKSKNIKKELTTADSKYDIKDKKETEATDVKLVAEEGAKIEDKPIDPPVSKIIRSKHKKKHGKDKSDKKD